MVFIDTSALFALAVRFDRDHERAVTCEGRLRSASEDLWTGLHVVQEFWYLLDARCGSGPADEAVRRLLDGGVQVIEPSARDIRDALRIGGDYADQDFSLSDRMSFSMLEHLGRQRVWCYDRDFAIYRYGESGASSFEIVQ